MVQLDLLQLVGKMLKDPILQTSRYFSSIIVCILLCHTYLLCQHGGHRNDNEQYDGEWIEVVKGSTTKTIKAAASLPNDNNFILLADNHGPRKTITTKPDTAIPIEQTYTLSERYQNKKGKQDCKLKQRMHRRQTLQRLAQQDNLFLKESITTAEDERTAMAKADKTEVKQNTIDKSHDQSNAKPTASITQLARNTTYGICTAFKRAATQILTNKNK